MYVNGSPVAKQIPFDNSTNGFTANNVQTAIEEAKNVIAGTSFISAAGTQTSTSTTYANITTMSFTPAAGTYIVTFNGRGSTSGASAGGLFALAVDGVIQTNSVRELSCNIVLLGIITVSLNTVAGSMTCVDQITVNGSQTITAQFRSTSGGTINIGERCMYLLRTA